MPAHNKNSFDKIGLSFRSHDKHGNTCNLQDILYTVATVSNSGTGHLYTDGVCWICCLGCRVGGVCVRKVSILVRHLIFISVTTQGASRGLGLFCDAADTV